jgi:hypothetical protein
MINRNDLLKFGYYLGIQMKASASPNGHRIGIRVAAAGKKDLHRPGMAM